MGSCFTLRVRIVTDSTASIPRGLCEELGITNVPVTVHFGTETFIDGVDPAEQFYQRLASAEQAPTTSTPSAGAFLAVYERLGQECDEIVSIHVMGTKSAVLGTAKIAAEMVTRGTVRVVDSGTTTFGLGMLVVQAARMALEGRSGAEIAAAIERLVPHVAVHVGIPGLTQLRRSGRVSLGQALMANMLGIKPILYVGQGAIEVVDKVRTWPRAVQRVIELAEQHVGGGPVALAVVHTAAEEEAQSLHKAVKDRFMADDVHIVDAGPALATHAGAGALGLITLRRS